MTKLEKVLYTAKAHTRGGREGGASRTDDGPLEVSLSSPLAPAPTPSSFSPPAGQLVSSVR